MTAGRTGCFSPRTLRISLATLGSTLAWVLLATPAWAQTEPESLTIAECAARARRVAPSVRVSQADLEAARYDSLSAARNRHPSFSLFGGAMIAPEGFYDPASTDLGHYELKAGVELPLLDGGERRRARLRAAQDAARAGIDLDRNARDAATRAAALAVEILRLREMEAWQRTSLAWLDRLASELQGAVRGGSHSPSDQLRVEIEREAVGSGLETSRVETDVAERELAQLLDVAETAPAIREPTPGEDVPPGEEDSLRVAVRTDLLAEVRAARVEHERSLIDLDEARRKNALRLGTSADVGFAGTNLTTAVPPDLESKNGKPTFADRLRRDAGASASFDFRRPFADATHGPAVRGREAASRARELELETEQATQRRLGIALLMRWRSAHRRVQTAADLVDRADRNLLRSRSLYAAGATVLLDVMDARRVLDDAHERLAQARADARAARYEAEEKR